MSGRRRISEEELEARRAFSEELLERMGEASARDLGRMSGFGPETVSRARSGQVQSREVLERWAISVEAEEEIRATLAKSEAAAAKYALAELRRIKKRIAKRWAEFDNGEDAAEE